MNILATYPNDYSMDDYREYVKEECDFEGVKFKESMINDDDFYNYCATQQDFDADYFREELAYALTKTKIKQGFLEIHNGGWQHQHGMTPMFDINASSVLDKLLGSGESTIEMYKQGHKLGFMRYSHDEPTGADITLHSGRHFEQVENEVFA